MTESDDPITLALVGSAATGTAAATAGIIGTAGVVTAGGLALAGAATTGLILANKEAKGKRKDGVIRSAEDSAGRRDKGVQFATEEDFQKDRKARRRRRLSITRGFDGSIPNPLAIN